MHQYQRGITLPITMLLMLAALTIGASAAHMAMLGEKAARAERDHLIAFQAAEDALMDAERDINAGLGQPVEVPPPQSATEDPASAPAWQVVDLAGDGGTEYGAFTGAAMPAGQGNLPFRRPRYLVERVAYTPAGAPPAYYYRVTVMGFGPRPGAETVLQASYTAPTPVRRHSWREVMDWQSLHDAAGGKGEP
jgi:type IV pilus assembly protein PilX